MQDKFDSPPSTEELIVDTSFVHFCLESNADDVVRWNTWLADNPQHQARIQEAKRLVLLLSDSPTDIEVSTEREKLLQSLGFERKIKRLSLVYRWSVAAIIVFFVGFYLFYSQSQSDRKIAGSTIVKHNVPSGKMMNLTLADGTAISLSSGSSLEYKSKFLDSVRIVNLNGDAKFKVAHVDDLPFVIHTEALDVKVLGTTFNMQAFETDRYSRVALFEGEVLVSTADGAYPIAPGQSFVLDKKLQKSSIEGFDKTEADEKINGLLVFDNASYEEVGHRLANKYGILFITNPKVEIEFSGTINDESLDQVLEKLNFTTNYHFYIEANTLKVKNK